MSNQRVRAQIWDTPGAREFQFITTIHYRFAVGALLVYDVTDFKSFKNLKEWLSKIREFGDEYIKIALIANKVDLVDRIDMTGLSRAILEDDDEQYESKE